VLTYDVTHLVVMQNLLPYLWRDGHLGGRTFDVLMTALPLSNLHERLNLAAARHPECRTLADFRAGESLVRAEDEALRQARKIVTPHSEIAALFKDKAVTLDWDKPTPRSLPKADTRHSRIVFPASTVGRKGAYELRAAIQGLDVQLRILGSQLEGDDFWRGISVERAPGGENWLDGVDALVLPAYVEHKPRRLLAALSSGIPVIASTACGLENTPGVINIEAGDATALRREIEKLN
jgi:hypothetical protein